MTTNTKIEIVRLAELKKYNKAKKLCTKLCKQTPNDPEAWFLLGSINGAIDNFTAAESCCKKALKFAPENPMLLFNLGMALLKQGKANAAKQRFENAIKHQPQFPDAYLELANALCLTGDNASSITNYKKAIQQNPKSIHAYHNLADAYRNTGQLPEALKNYEKAISLQKDFVESYNGLASTYIAMFHYDKAIDLLESSISFLPSNSYLYFCLAAAYQEQGETNKARINFTKALEIDPGYADAQSGLAAILALQGDYDKAGQLLTCLLEKHPENSAAIITYVTYANQFGATKRAIKLGTDFLADNIITDQTKSKLLFALAKLHEKRDELNVAFSLYQQGNILRRSKFDEDKHIEMFKSFVNTYSKSLFEKLHYDNNTAITPIFIIGMPRSGTSLAEQILASHPDIYGAGELPTINRLIKKLPEKLSTSTPYPECVENLSPQTLSEIAEEYIKEATTSSNNEKFITDKMPLNAIHLGFISLLFPNAPIIHCTRNPRDTCLSCFFTNFSGEHSYAFSLNNLGKFYRMYHNQMKHWSKTISNPIFELSYENVVENPDQVIRDLVNFCGVEWNDACLNFHKTKRTVATASHDQVRKKIYSSSVGKWRNYEQYLEELFSALNENN